MRWVDVCGPPGCGKSTLCYRYSDGSELWGDKSVVWDGKQPPSYWKPFLDELSALTPLVKDHLDPHGQPTIEAVQRMCNRSIGKMSAVERMEPPEGRFPVFVQTGLVQRILGFGWRLHEMGRDINLIRPALWRMPVSVGVAVLEAPLETILARNRKREQDWREGKASHNENRSHQVPHMLACMPMVKEVLLERGIPVASINVERQSIDEARAELLAFADREPCDAAKMGLGR
jgi:hypothetical protein